MNWTSSTSNTDVIYDDDANTTTTDDQQTVTVNVGSSTTPPPAITGAVYNNGVLEISLGDANATDAVAAKIFIGGSALDITSNDVNFVAADTGNNTPAKVTVGGLNWTSSTSNTDVIYDDDANTTTTDDQQTVTVNVGSSTTPPPAITGAVYNNGVLEISLGDVNATDAVAAKIFIGGSALDINSNDVNFVAADTGNNTPAKVTVGGLNWTSSTSNTDVIYDDDANTTTTDDQQTVTVNVGSSTTPPPAITGAVYNNGVLEISLGDVNATDAVAAKIFIGGSALDINSNDVNFVAADTGNNTPAKVTVGGLNWTSSTSNTDVIYDDDANTTTTDDQQTVTVNVGSSTTPPPAITGAVYNNGVLEDQPW